jgi:lycopene beta-cyclase
MSAFDDHAPQPGRLDPSTPDYDVILVGGGLANGLIADRLTALRPELRILLLEQGPTLGGNHTWSFHDTDITADQHLWMDPYVVHRWARQEVRFPGLTRVLETGYCSVSSDQFHTRLTARLGHSLRLNSEIVSVETNAVQLASQERLTAACVIDGRGPRSDPALALGYQKFIGREIETVEPHGRTWPVIMDATVAQNDGYRFVYTLPLDDRRLLIEDTYYSDTPDLDLNPLRGGIDTYAATQGWTIARDLREETGVLPIVLAGNMDAYWHANADQPRVGLRAALFHPTTGYSLPDAVVMAELIAAAPTLTSAKIAEVIKSHSLTLWQQRSFYRLLNRMLYMAAKPTERAAVLAQFYTRPEPLIQRFYAGRLTWLDQARILSGRPPVPVGKALSAMSQRSAWRFTQTQPGQK